MFLTIENYLFMLEFFISGPEDIKLESLVGGTSGNSELADDTPLPPSPEQYLTESDDHGPHSSSSSQRPGKNSILSCFSSWAASASSVRLLKFAPPPSVRDSVYTFYFKNKRMYPQPKN